MLRTCSYHILEATWTGEHIISRWRFAIDFLPCLALPWASTSISRWGCFCTTSCRNVVQTWISQPHGPKQRQFAPRNIEKPIKRPFITIIVPQRDPWGNSSHAWGQEAASWHTQGGWIRNSFLYATWVSNSPEVIYLVNSCSKLT